MVGIWKVMVSSLSTSALAAWMANRSEPSPESLVLVTMNGLTTTCERTGDIALAVKLLSPLV